MALSEVDSVLKLKYRVRTSRYRWGADTTRNWQGSGKHERCFRSVRIPKGRPKIRPRSRATACDEQGPLLSGAVAIRWHQDPGIRIGIGSSSDGGCEPSLTGAVSRPSRAVGAVSRPSRAVSRPSRAVADRRRFSPESPPLVGCKKRRMRVTALTAGHRSLFLTAASGCPEV